MLLWCVQSTALSELFLGYGDARDLIPAVFELELEVRDSTQLDTTGS